MLHDNAHPHTAAHTVDTLRALKFEVLKHPPYSPDLAPSDFHLFGPMKEHLNGSEVCRYQRGNGGGAKLVKGHAKKLFSGGHPQACGQVDQVCCEAGGPCPKIGHKQFLEVLLLKRYYKIPVI